MTAGLRAYLTGTALFLIPGGIQVVLFPWLVVVQLHESPVWVGTAQMANQLPMLLLILWGGWLGDQVDQRRLLIGLHLGMMVPPLVMAAVIGVGALTYGALIVWAIVGGAFAAFAQPARDALLNRVASGDIQRVVTLAVGVQFGVQIVGFGFGAAAGTVGPIPVMILQALFMLAAAVAIARVPPPPPATARRVATPALRSIADGIVMAWQSPIIRPVVLLTFAVGVFFAGAYLVLIPLMVRDIYQGGALEIAFAFAANMLGTCTVIAILMRRGGIDRPGRALLIGALVSSTTLSMLHLSLPQIWFYVVIYFWGCCGGISMTLSRSLVQEVAPASHRARLMSVYSLGMMGGMPLGSLFLGAVADVAGAKGAVLVAAGGMACVALLVWLTSGLWHARRQLVADEGPAAAT